MIFQPRPSWKKKGKKNTEKVASGFLPSHAFWIFFSHFALHLQDVPFFKYCEAGLMVLLLIFWGRIQWWKCWKEIIL